MKDLLQTADLTTADLRLLLNLAELAKIDPLRWRRMLTARSVVLYFAKPSTRTRISTATAVAHLGAVPLTVGPDELQLGRGETIEDTARVLGSYASAIVVRTFADEDIRRFATASPVPVVNALTDGHHPLQSITDVFTARELFGELRGRRLAYVGAGNNVAHSLMQACALAGMDIAVATPAEFAPDPCAVAEAEKLAADTGSRVEVGVDPIAAVRGACVVYTDVWVSMGDAAQTQAARLATLAPYRVTPALMAHAAPDAVFLHCLPAHRGEEVAAEVIDGHRSEVFRQAANRKPVVQAVLRALIEDRIVGNAGPRSQAGDP
jgi:ornithine carbamoyltransferase